jgi:hypothetical protein
MNDQKFGHCRRVITLMTMIADTTVPYTLCMLLLLSFAGQQPSLSAAICGDDSLGTMQVSHIS